MPENREETDLAQHAREAQEALRNRAEQEIGSRKGTIAHEVAGIAEALRITAEQLDRQGQHMVAGYADGASRAVDEFASSMENKSVSELVQDLEHTCREQPMLVAGIAALVGLVGSRLLRSGPSESAEDIEEYRYAAEGETPFERQVSEETDEPMVRPFESTSWER